MSATDGLWLLDNSAWSRMLLPNLPKNVAFAVAADLRARRFAVSLPFLLEAGYSARDSSEYREMFEGFEQLPHFQLGQPAADRALDCQAQLVRAGHHRIPPADIEIAAIADTEGLGIIHYDADYDRILEKTDLAFKSRWLAPRGTL